MIAWTNINIVLFFLVFPAGSAFQVLYKRQHQYTRLAAIASNDDDDEHSGDDVISIDETTVQDLRSFVTQRCIQSFMFLLASTRDLHTVKWIDSLVKPITLNNYWEEDEVSL